MREIKHIINDPEGIHARPAGLFVREASAFPCKITVSKGDMEADAKGIFAVMGLGAKFGDEVVIRIEGEREENAAKALNKFLETNL